MKRRAIGLVLAGMVVTCMSTAKGADRPLVVSSFRATAGAKYPFYENMYEPLTLPDGRILALSFARQNDQQWMEGRYSSDEGHTWSEPQHLFDFPKQAGAFALFERLLDRDGEIHIFTLCDGNSGLNYPKEKEGKPEREGEILDIWHVRSRDGRTRWEAPKPIWTGHGDDLLSVIQLRNGRILLPFASATNRSWKKRGGGFLEFTYVGSYGIRAVYSDDDGVTWQTSPDELTVETPDLFTYGANEPVVLQLNDGRVWMLMRTQRGRFYESFSPDGARWSAPQPSQLISSDSPAGLIRLKDGSILLFSNACLRYPYAYGGRYVLHGAISHDEGRTWRGFRELFRDPDRNDPVTYDEDYGVSYTFPTLTPQGNVLFTNWVERGAIRRFKLLDPAWLDETRQETDFTSGLEDWSIFGSHGVELQTEPANGAHVLSLRKADAGWPAAAVWNFPVGANGSLKIQLLLRPGFGGILIGLTDHFSVPWDDEDKFFNVFNVEVTADGQMLPGIKLAVNKWHQLELAWDLSRRECRVLLDGTPVGVLQGNRHSEGLNYVRLRSTAARADSGLLLRRVAADVSSSWLDMASSLHARGR